MAYLLPTVPLFAIFISTQISAERFLVSRFPILLAAFLALLCCTVPFAAPRFSDKLPAGFYRQVMEAAPDERFYFIGETPYSAEFYLGDRVINHPKEDRRVSIAKSRDDVLMMRRRDTRIISEIPGRKLLLTDGSWSAYAPEEGDFQ